MSNDPVIPADSRAILIGVPNYQDDKYTSYPEVRNSVDGMYELLVESGLCGWQPKQVDRIIDPVNAGHFLGHLQDLAEQVTGVLLLYFVGHGVLSRRGELCLAISDTNHARPDATGLKYPDIKEILYKDTSAATRIVILDSCYSGRAIGLGTTDGPTQLADLSAPDVGEGLKPGAYTLTAADNLAYVSADADADAEGAKRVSPDAEGPERTAFTGELLDLLTCDGIPGGPAGLTLGGIFPRLRTRLGSKGLPLPNQRADDLAADFVFARNAARTLATQRPPATSAESASTTVIAPPADTAQLLNERNTGDTSQLALAPDELRTPPARSATIPPSPVPSEEPESELPPKSETKQRFSGFRRNRRRTLLAVTAGAAAGLSCALAAFWSGPDTHHPTVAATIPLDYGATSVAVDPATHDAFVVYGTSLVADINTTTNIVTSIDIGSGDLGPIAIPPGNRAAYVGDTTSSAVSVINTASNKISSTMTVGHVVRDIAIDPATRTAYFVSTDPSAIKGGGTVISRSVKSGTRTINVGSNPTAIAIDPDAHTAYVTDSDGSVSAINTVSNKVTATVSLNSGSADAIAVDPADHTAYVANSSDNTVSVINTAVSPFSIRSVSDTIIRVGKNPSAVAVDPDAHTAYVTNSDDGTVSVIDTTTNKITDVVRVGPEPQSVAVDPETHIAYVANKDTDSIQGSLSVLKPS